MILPVDERYPPDAAVLINIRQENSSLSIFEQTVHAVENNPFESTLAVTRRLPVVTVTAEIHLYLGFCPRRPDTHKVMAVQLIEQDIALREIERPFFARRQMQNRTRLEIQKFLNTERCKSGDGIRAQMRHRARDLLQTDLPFPLDGNGILRGKTVPAVQILHAVGDCFAAVRGDGRHFGDQQAAHDGVLVAHIASGEIAEALLIAEFE